MSGRRHKASDQKRPLQENCQSHRRRLLHKRPHHEIRIFHPIAIHPSAMSNLGLTLGPRRPHSVQSTRSTTDGPRPSTALQHNRETFSSENPKKRSKGSDPMPFPPGTWDETLGVYDPYRSIQTTGTEENPPDHSVDSTETETAPFNVFRTKRPTVQLFHRMFQTSSFPPWVLNKVSSGPGSDLIKTRGPN